jgi:hypothetical protein
MFRRWQHAYRHHLPLDTELLQRAKCKLLGSNGGEYEGDLSSGMLRRVVCYKFTGVSEIVRAIIALITQAAGIYETSLNFYLITRCSIPENTLLRLNVKFSLALLNIPL